ncbi:MAG: hypothetical protein ACXV8W_15200 [Methylobacter sp.]
MQESNCIKLKHELTDTLENEASLKFGLFTDRLEIIPASDSR